MSTEPKRRRTRPAAPVTDPHVVQLRLDDDSYGFVTTLADIFDVPPEQVALGMIQAEVRRFDANTKKTVARFVKEVRGE